MSCTDARCGTTVCTCDDHTPDYFEFDTAVSNSHTFVSKQEHEKERRRLYKIIENRNAEKAKAIKERDEAIRRYEQLKNGSHFESEDKCRMGECKDGILRRETVDSSSVYDWELTCPIHGEL